MNSPEQQPTSEPEKNPQPEMGTDELRKYLDEAYGSGNSSITVDKTIPIPETPKTEPMQTEPELKKETISPMSETPASKLFVPPDYGNKPPIFKPETIDPKEEAEKKILAEEAKKVQVETERNQKEIDNEKRRLEEEQIRQEKESKTAFPKEKREFQEGPIELKKPEEIKNEAELGTKENPIIAEVVEEKKPEEPTIEQLAEKVRQEKALQDAQIEVAKNELIELARSMKEAREKKDTRTEYSVYDKAEGVFKTATGESLETVVKEKAKIEAEDEGLRVVTEENFRKEKTAKIRDEIRQEKRSLIINNRWERLSDQEKEKYFDKEKDKNDSGTIESARQKFAVELNEKINEKIKELAEGKKGISMSQDLFYKLMDMEYKSEDIKKAGWFSRGKIEALPLPLNEADKRSSLVITKEFLAVLEAKVRGDIEKATELRINKKINKGKEAWSLRKQRHTREIIRETAVKYEAEKKPKEELKKPETETTQPTETEKEPNPSESVSYINRVIRTEERNKKDAEERLVELKKLREIIRRGEALNPKQKATLVRTSPTTKKVVKK